MKVTLISKTEENLLVEGYHQGKLSRRIVPTNAVNIEGEISPETFEQGIEYGLPLEELLDCIDTNTLKDRITLALHNRGIYTLEDVSAHKDVVGAAIMVAMIPDIDRLETAAREYQAKLDAPKTKKASPAPK